VAKKKSSPFSFKLLFKLPKFMGGPSGVPPAQETKTIPSLRLIFFIVDWANANFLSEVFDEEKVRFHFISKGRGTASSDILDLLGIGAGDKAVVICLEQEVLASVLIKEVRKKLNFNSPGAGIAFTVPLSGINTPILKVFKESINKNEKIAPEKEGETPMAVEIKHDLIIAIINQGYSDEFMTIAREAGATGGTVINARGLAHEGAVRFFGVSVQDEKEIIIVLTSREKKVPIMQAVSQNCGMTSKAEGIVFSLPVDAVQGLSFE
jgi:nitrogen regulatory protein PII